MSVTPTFYQGIRQLFTQHDRIMMMFYCDFWNYEQVVARAESIYLSLQPAQPGANPGGWSKLPEVHVMPTGTGPWPQEQIDLFGAWIDAGCPEGTPPPVLVPGDLVPQFIEVSKILTGFAVLDTLGDVDILAQRYIDRILASEPCGGQLAAFLTEAETEEPAALLNADGTIAPAFSAYSDVMKAITLAWYTATVDNSFGTPEDTQYIQGLEWRAMAAHPMGFANDNVPFYWQFKPEGEMYTGLIPWVVPSK